MLGDPCQPSGPRATATKGWFKLGVVYYVAIASQGIGEKERLPPNRDKTASLFNSGGRRATQIPH